MKAMTAVATLCLFLSVGCSRKGAGGPARVPVTVARAEQRAIPFQAALAQAQAMLARDQAQAQSAVLDAQRYAELVKQDYVTKSDYEAKRAAAEALQAVVRADSAAAASAALNLDWATIRAPIAGRTGRLLVREG